MVLLERKVIAWAQSRLGRCGSGLRHLQPVADAIKLDDQEDITPTRRQWSSRPRQSSDGAGAHHLRRHSVRSAVNLFGGR
jgi:hypothetical protein